MLRTLLQYCNNLYGHAKKLIVVVVVVVLVPEYARRSYLLDPVTDRFFACMYTDEK